MNTRKDVPETQPDNPNEESGLLKELESSSEGKVKGSLLWSYFKYTNQPCVLIFLVASVLVTQLLASGADVWVSYW